MLLSAGTKETLAWVVPAWLLHAALIIYQAFTNWVILGEGGQAIQSSLQQEWLVRGVAPTGLSFNANLAAGFLVMGIIYLLTTRFRWLAVPLLLALPLTGSRWAALVCVALIVGMVLMKRVPVWTLGAMAIGGVAAFLLLWSLGERTNYGLAGFDSFGSLLSPFRNGALSQRLAIPHIPSILVNGLPSRIFRLSCPGEWPNIRGCIMSR